jgi:hypothetical protein
MNRLQAVALVIAVLSLGQDGWAATVLAVGAGASLIADALLPGREDDAR